MDPFTLYKRDKTVPAATMAKLSRLENLLSSEWSLALVGPYLPVVDWYSLSCVSKSCHRSVLRQMPEETLAFVKDLKGAETKRLLVFGVHNTHKEKRSEQEDLFRIFRNPAPVIQFSFDALWYNASEHKLSGRPWSELSATYSSPISLGRVGASVCATDESGHTIFYCGGRYVARNREQRWVWENAMDDKVSSTAALFDVDTASWHSMPPMPEARYGAGICRVGKRIFIIGGRLDRDWSEEEFEEDVVSRSLLCFDCVKQEWLDREIPDYPGSAYAGFSVVALDKATMLVVGGETITEYPQYGPFVEISCQVFTLDIPSATWTRLPDLPESVAPKLIDGGPSVEAPRNGNEGMCVVVNNGQKSACLVMDPRPHWKQLPDLPDGGFHRLRWCCSAVFGGGLMAAFFASQSYQIYGVRSKVWRAVPPENGFMEYGVNLCDPTGEECRACLGFGNTIVPVV